MARPFARECSLGASPVTMHPRFVALSPGVGVWDGPVVGGLPSVSVVISTHRRESLLPLALASVAAVEGVDVEVVVFDDTPGQDLVVPDGVVPGVRVVRRGAEPSRGLGYARSRLLSQVEGDVVVVVDDDFILDGVVLRELAEVHRRVDGPVIASAPLYMVREDFARDVTPEVVFELVRCGQLERLASAYLLDSHYTVKVYGQELNAAGVSSRTLLAGHSSFVSFRADLPALLGIDYLPIRRAEDSAFGDAALTRGAGLVWCQAGLALHIGLTEMGRLRVSEDEFQRYESWRQSVSFGWLPTSGRPNILPKRGLDRTWARPSVAICLFLGGLDRAAVAQMLSELSRWDVRDWIVTVADESLLDADSRSVLEQFALDESRYVGSDQFLKARWDASWQLFIKPVTVEDVRELMTPLCDQPLHLVHASSGWSSDRGYIVRSHLLARKQVRQRTGWGLSEEVARWDVAHDSAELIPTSADLKRLQSEDEVSFHLVASPEVMLMSEDAVAPLVDLHEGASQTPSAFVQTGRVTVLAHPDELDTALHTHRDDVLALMQRGVLINQGTSWSPTQGHSGWVQESATHHDYLGWRIHQKRQFLALAHRPEVDAVSFGIVTTTKRPQMWANMVANLARQTHQPHGVLIVCHGWTPSEAQLQALDELHIPHTTAMVAPATADFGETFADVLDEFKHGDWFVKMDDDDLYGAQFLQELATHIVLNPSIRFVGMYAEFVETIHPHGRRLNQYSVGWQRRGGVFQPGCPAGGTLCIAAQVLPQADEQLREANAGIDVWIGETLADGNVGPLVLDGLNYILRRYSDPTHSHTWTAGRDGHVRQWRSEYYFHYLTFLNGE